MNFTSAEVTWEAIPEDYIHGVIQGYSVAYKDQESHEESNVTTENLSSPYSVVLHDLKNFATYCVRVLGYTRKGPGARSDCFIFSTDTNGKVQGLYVLMSHILGVQTL